MALCQSVSYNLTTCQLYGQGACIKYLGNKHVQNKFSDRNIASEYDASLNEVLTYLYLVLPNLQCKEYLSILLCHFIYPLCIPPTIKNTNVTWSKHQKICKKTCHYFSQDLCPGLSEDFKGIMLDYLVINYKSDSQQQFRNDIEKFLNGSCTNEKVYENPKDDKSKDCFHKEIVRIPNTSCDGNGHEYIGKLNVTINGNACRYWNSTCLKHAYIDFENITMQDKNFCRNPSGYRESPWCYVDDINWDYCNVSKCPGVDGNYSTWSAWEPCNVECGSGESSRNRSCVNPSPQYGGRNCSVYGVALETKPCVGKKCKVTSDLENIVISSSVIGTLLMILFILVFMYKNKRHDLETGDKIKLDANNIKKILAYREEDERDEKLEEVYSSYKIFKECLCVKCIERWLNTIMASVDGEVDKMYVQQLLKDLKTTGKESKVINHPVDSTAAEEETEDNNSLKEEELFLCSGTCFFEEDEVSKWYKSKARYDRLDKDIREEDNRVFLVAGLYLDSFPIYHKLNHGMDDRLCNTAGATGTTDKLSCEKDIEDK